MLFEEARQMIIGVAALLVSSDALIEDLHGFFYSAALAE